MSQFTESYFLKSSQIEDAIHLLKKAGLEGYVFPERDGWVAFVADTTPLYKFSENLKAVNEGILIQFVNAEDYGWEFEIYMKNTSVCSYSCYISEEMNEEDYLCVKQEKEDEGFEKLLTEGIGKFEVLRKYFDPNTKKIDIIAASDFTEDMKLYFSDWVSYHYADLQQGEMGEYGDIENLKLVKVDK